MSQIRTGVVLIDGEKQYDASVATNPASHAKHVHIPLTADGSMVRTSAVFTGSLAVTLDPANDGVEIYGSSDGGATQTVIHTDGSGDIQTDILSLPAITGAVKVGSPDGGTNTVFLATDGSDHALIDISEVGGSALVLGPTAGASSLPVALNTEQLDTNGYVNVNLGTALTATDDSVAVGSSDGGSTKVMLATSATAAGVLALLDNAGTPNAILADTDGTPKLAKGSSTPVAIASTDTGVLKLLADPAGGAQSLVGTVNVGATGTIPHILIDGTGNSFPIPCDTIGVPALAYKGITPTSLQTDASDHLMVDIETVSGSVLALGQTTDAASVPVTISSDQTNASDHVLTDISEIGGSTLALGQTTDAASIPVTVSSDQTNASDHVMVDIMEIGGSTVALGQAADTASIPVTVSSDQTNASDHVMVDIMEVGGSTLALGQAANTASLPVTFSTDQTDGSDHVMTDLENILGNPVDVGSGSASTGTQRVILADDQDTVKVKEEANAGSAVTFVNDNAASVTLKASNANRKGLSLCNTSTANLYVKFGATATTSDFTVLMLTNDYYEVPFGYTGIVDGIWASDPNTGGCAVTEITLT